MTSDSVFERHSKLFSTLIIIVIVLAMDFSFGKIYQIIVGHPWSESGANRSIMGERAYRVRSDFYDHGLMPNVNLHGYWGAGRYQFATDSLGFKNSEPQEIALKSNKHRILLIGDSFTEGVGVPYKDTFAGLISSELSGQNIEVLNAGVVSYSPKTYYGKIKYLIENVGLIFDEVFVFLDISDLTNELGPYYSFGDKGEVTGRKVPDKNPKKKTDSKINNRGRGISGFLKRNSIMLHYIYQVFIRNLDDEFKGVFANSTHGRLDKAESLWTVTPELFDEYGKEGLGYMQESMDLLRELLTQKDISLSVAIYPWPDQIVHNEAKSVYAQYWQEWSKKYNINFLNYFPDFISEKNTKEDHRRILDEYFIKGDVHWNKKGHQLIADKFIKLYNNRN